MAANEVLVLCYHAIADLSDDPVLAQYGIPREEFAAQVDSLLARGFTFLSPDQFAAFLNKEEQVPEKSALLTFDDCYQELAEVAETLLEPRGVKGIAFAVTGMRSGTNEWDQAIGAGRLELLDEAGLKKLASHGVEIGCHSRSHRPLPSVPQGELKDETKGAADELEAMGLERPRFFAYPHGANDQASRAAVANAGFTAAFALMGRPASATSDRFAVPRVEILARDRGWRFGIKTRWQQLERLTRLPSIALRYASRAARALRRRL